MLIRTATTIAVALNVIGASDAGASCRRVEVPDIIGIAVFKHYRHDGGEVVDVLLNNDVVRYHRTVGRKALVRKLQIGKRRKTGWVSRSVLSKRQVSCVAYQQPHEEGAPRVHLPDWLQLFLDRLKQL
jgi:hypothetical protein